MTIDQILQIVQQGGLPMVAILILYGGAKQIWVWGYQLKEMRQERDEWKAIATRGAALTERATNVAVGVTTQQFVSR